MGSWWAAAIIVPTLVLAGCGAGVDVYVKEYEGADVEVKSCNKIGETVTDRGVYPADAQDGDQEDEVWKCTIGEQAGSLGFVQVLRRARVKGEDDRPRSGVLGRPLDGASPSVQAPLSCSAAAIRAASCAQRRKNLLPALSPARRTLLAVDVETRTLVRRSVSDARRRLTGAEFDETGVAGMQTSGSRNKSLPLLAWEACDGDSLLALAYVLDVLKAKQEGQLDAA
jgi:hypothetical protein